MARRYADLTVSHRAYDSDGRWQVLGGLRFVLAMVVVSGHLSWFTPTGRPLLLTNLGGTSAVLGFLVISGYSIAHSLDRRPQGFYRRRVLRIYPLYAAAVLYATVPFWFVLGTMGPSVGGAYHFTVALPTAGELVGNLLMAQNVACSPVGTNLLVWTLGIEAACYLAAPAVRAWPTVVVLALLAVSAGAFGTYPRTGLAHYGTLLFGLPLLMFAWACWRVSSSTATATGRLGAA